MAASLDVPEFSKESSKHCTVFLQGRGTFEAESHEKAWDICLAMPFISQPSPLMVVPPFFLSFSLYEAYVYIFKILWIRRWKSWHKYQSLYYSYRLWSLHDIFVEKKKKALTWAINWGFQTSPLWFWTAIKACSLVTFLRDLTLAVLEVSLMEPRMSFWPHFWLPSTFWFLSLKF